MNIDELFISSEMLKTYLYVGITLLIAVLIDNILRALIRVPKHFDNRRARRFTAITRTVITVITYIIAGYTVLMLLGVDLTPLLASATAVAIILSIGARPIIEDFVTGIFLLSLNSIAVGDYVKSGETEGYIESIDSRTLMIRADTGALHIIPNSQVKELVNFSRNKINLIIDLPVKANQDITKVMKAANNALKELQEDEKIKDALFAESSVDGIEDFKSTEIMSLRVTLTTYPVRRWEVGRRYRYLVKKEFEKNKITFA